MIWTYTSSFYGTETWYSFRNASVFKDFTIVYHKCVKKVAGLNVWDSNHEACEIVNVPIFKHLLATILISVLFRVVRSESPCGLPFRFYLRFMSDIYKSIAHFFMQEYSISNIFESPLCAILARIDYVQRNEPRRHRIFLAVFLLALYFNM